MGAFTELYQRHGITRADRTRMPELKAVVHAPPRTGSRSMLMLAHLLMRGRLWHLHYMINQYYYHHNVRLRGRIENLGKDNYKIICTIRDPIARNLSEYWRRWLVNHAMVRGANDRFAIMRRQLALQYLDGSNEEKFMAWIDHYRQHEFFGGELISYWGIDIFKMGAFTPPYRIYDDRLLIIRCEDMNEYGVEAVCKLFGIEKLEMEMLHLNIHPIPKKRTPINLTQSYIDAMYYDEFFPKWFYTEDEIDGFKEKWMAHVEC